MLFLVSGMLTCFLDFLTTEIITLLVPVLLVLFIRKEEDRFEGLKKTIIFVIKTCALWGIAYVAMWIAKWLIASVVLNINAIDYVRDNALLRINGTRGFISIEKMYKEVIYQNWHNLYPINIIKRKADLLKIIIIFILITICSFDWKNIRKKWFSIIVVLIAIMPYIRYLVLASHSYSHNFFTFRNQIITIISIGMIYIDCFNYKLWFKKIELKKKKVNDLESKCEKNL